MENASKALIIAGAILLSIAIIGIGMAVFSMASQSASGADLSQQEIESYNATFIRYEGAQNGSTVKTLLNTIRTHNQTNSNDKSKQILVNGAATGTVKAETASAVAKDCASASEDGADGSSSETLNSIRNMVKSGTRYTISFGYSTTGMIKRINITVKK